AYSDRILGEKADNLELAIACYQQSLITSTRESFLVDWAMTKHNLGRAYKNRILGDKADNLETAIACLQQSLMIRTPKSFPVDWGRTQNNLGNAYKNRILGERSNNLEQAIACYQQSLKVFPRESLPVDWAMTHVNLGLAYSERILGEKADNREKAIACYQKSLKVYTRESFPIYWATIQNNLGLTYRDRILEDKADNLEMAIACLQQSLRVYTRESFPIKWANTQNNLGTAYRDRILGERDQNLEEAIACFQNALQILTPTALPLDCLRTGAHLGNTAFTLGNWQLAIQGYGKAIDAVEQSRSWATNEQRRQEILAESIDIYEKMVQACINNGQLDKAIEYTERSRSQRLVDLMASNDLYAGGEIPPEVKLLLEEYQDKQQEIDQLIKQLRWGNDASKEPNLVEAARSRAATEAYSTEIQALESELQTIWQQIRQLDPVLSGEIKVVAPNLAAMQQLVDDDKTAILIFYTTSDDTHIFILQNNQISLHTCKGQGQNTLQSWISENWLLPYVQNKPVWKSQIGSVLGEIASRLRLDDLIAEHLKGIEELVIVPHLFLHQIPFAALPIAPPSASQNGILSDQFLIRYVPSCQILEYCKNRPSVQTLLEYGIVEDATEDLPCASFEGEQIAQLYQIPENRRHRGLKGATVANYRQLAKQVQGIVSSHHAQSRLDNPLQSELVLGDGSITLGELLTPGWRLPQLVDVFLSCCETGLGLPETLTDDLFTLSFGFLCAGARSVVSTLWAVDDLATALFSLFYHQHKQNFSRPAALRKAQADLRRLTGETLATEYKPLLLALLEKKQQQIEAALEQADSALDEATAETEDYLQKEYDRIGETLEILEKIVKRLDYACQEPLPFSDYFYWSAFTCQGLR
ncbi:MAG: CHAT domain-containing protein, partial [Coleofasciculaceae cyanobacterium]